MDIARPDLKRKKTRRRSLWAIAASLLIAAMGFAVTRLKPAAPSVDRSSVWTDTVKRGPMVRQVRGIGTLAPREDRIRLIPAETEATVVRLRVLPGARVAPDTVVMDLTDPQLEQELLTAQLGLKAAQVEYTNLQAKLRSDMMTERAGAATVTADHTQAQKQAQTDKALYDLGVIFGLAYSASQGKADELKTRDSIEADRLAVNNKAVATQLEVQQTRVDEARALLALKQRQQGALEVRAGISGVLVELPHQVGEHVLPGTTLAKVVQPDQLKASLKIAETQARDIQLGQPAEIDTHNGTIAGKVSRIDPAVSNGTVTVDVELMGALPQGARPDLSGIYLRIDRGEYIAMSGPSGCGKSTLLSIVGLLDTPTGGSYELNGKPVANLSFAERSRIRNQEIGFIFQSFNLIGDLTVFENVELPLTYRPGMAASERRDRVQRALERVSMAHRMPHYPAQLSGGQQQRVAVARALAGAPSILLADEPTGNLDSKNGEAVMQLLAELHAEGSTICMVTHDPRFAAHADRQVNLFDGKVVSEDELKRKLAEVGV